MNVIVAGSRSILAENDPDGYDRQTARQKVADAISASPFEIDTLVHGDAPGVDTLAKEWAYRQNDWIDIEAVPAEWDDTDHPDAVVKTRRDGSKYNAAAGPIRNRKMAQEHGEALVAVWDRDSRGTKSMIKLGVEILGADNVFVYDFHADEPIPLADIDL